MSTIYLLGIDQLDVSGVGVRKYVSDQTIDYLIHRQFYTHNDGKPEYKNWWVDISKKEAEKNIHRNAPTALKRLTEHDILQRTTYEPGVKSFGYRIHPDVLNRFRITKLSKSDMHHHAFNSLKKKVSSLRYKVNRDQNYLRSLAEMVMDLEVDDEGIDVALDSDDRNGLKSLIDIRNHRIHFVSDTKSGRVFTNYTNLPSQYRPYVTLPGVDELVEVDVSGCNFVLLSSLLSGCSVSPYMKDGNSGVSHTSSLSVGNSPYMKDSKPTPKTREFIKLSENGEIYDKITELSRPHYQREPKRKWIKKKALMILNERTDKLTADRRIKEVGDEQVEVSNSKMKKIYQSLRDEYPQVMGFVEWMKKDDHGDLGRHLMKMESSIMIDGVAKKLIEQGIPVLTIHDCIVIPKEFTLHGDTLIKEEFRDQIGLGVSTTIEQVR